MSDNKNGWWAKIKTLILPYYEIFSNFAESEKGKLTGKVISYTIQAGIIVYLGYQLTQIGWGNFLAALPVNPLFYLLFLVIYGALPVTEIYSYKQSWNIGFWESIPIYIKKRVFNKNFIGYSGEVFVYSWARKKNFGTDKDIFKVIRDNNIVSSLASTTIVFGLLLAFIISGRIAFINEITNNYDTFTIISVSIIVIILAIFAYYNRQYFFSMPARIAMTVFTFHSFRMLLINAVQILIWHIIMPEVSFSIWFTFLSIQLIISRIPFLPNRDLFYIGASLEVSHMIDVSVAGIAGLLVAQNVLDKLLNMGLFTMITIREGKQDTMLQMPD
ncbi:MAG: hypothetical protein PVI44_05395 [Balneolaceae bacterium]|jgi:hypothetical protein